MGSRCLLVSAANDAYFPLYEGLLRSLLPWKARLGFDLGLLDIGLKEERRQRLLNTGVILRTPQIDIDYPARAVWEEKAPYFRAMTSRPFLPSYFPDHDVLMWIDADCWVQTDSALRAFLTGAAQDPSLFISSEFDLAYDAARKPGAFWGAWAKMFENCLPVEEAQRLTLLPLLNCGVFALAAKAPHWRAWQEKLRQSLLRMQEMTQAQFPIEQVCLNAICYEQRLPFRPMPAEYNWLVAYGLPFWDEKQKTFVRPFVPGGSLSILHLAGSAKNLVAEIPRVGGGCVKTSFDYTAYEKLRAS